MENVQKDINVHNEELLLNNAINEAACSMENNNNIDIEALYKKVDEMYKWYSVQKCTNVRKEESIENVQFKISLHDDEIVNRTFRIHKNVLSELKEFCTKNSNLKQQDIISQLLMEALQKYK